MVRPEAIVELQLAPARLIEEAASPVRPSTVVPEPGLGCPETSSDWPLDRTLATAAASVGGHVIDRHEILESIEPASVTPRLIFTAILFP